MRGCSRIYLEAYTSILLIEKEKLVSGMSVLVSYSEPVKKTVHQSSSIPWLLELRGCVLLRQEEYYGKEVIVADREMVESQVDAILCDADKEDVAFLVVGDPFG